VLLLDLEQMIAAKVVGRLELLNGEVERLVREAVDRELDRLIGELVSERDGAGDRDASPAMRVCNGCGTAKLPSAFERGRGTCKTCRRRQDRARAQARRSQPAEAANTEPFQGA
jgi:hypothetical protein